MKRLLMVVVSAILAFALLFGATSLQTNQAHAATLSKQPQKKSTPASSVKPDISGGGCSGYVMTRNTNILIEVNSCTSATNIFGQNVEYPDSYGTYGSSNSSLWSSCSATVSLVNSSYKTIASSSTDCLSNIRSNATGSHYMYNGQCTVWSGGSNGVCVGSGKYYNYACISAVWNGTFYQACASSPWSTI